MINLKDFGSFYIQGRMVESTHSPSKTYAADQLTELKDSTNGKFSYLIEQVYVQYFIPANLIHDVPVVLVHGGGQTGSVWENTPDGRKGWLHYFIEAGFATYVIDNIERGRSGWCSIPDIWDGVPELRSAQENWELFR